MQTNPFIRKKRCSRAKEAYGNSDFKKPPDNDMSPPILDIQYWGDILFYAILF